MKNLYRACLLSAVLYFCIPAYAHHLAVVVQQDNHTPSMSTGELGKILKAETRHWSDGKEVVVVLNKDSVAIMQMVERLSNVPRSGVKAFLAAHKSAFVLVGSDAEVLNTVQGMPGAMGLVDVRAVTAKVNVVKVDGKLPLERGYLPD